MFIRRKSERRNNKLKLTTRERRQIQTLIKKAQEDKKSISAQKTIPYDRMWPDGVCRVRDNHYNKTIQFFDINYQLATNEDKDAIFNGWCDVLNYFPPGMEVQFSFVNTVASQNSFEQSVKLPPGDDAFNDVRDEFAAMLESQMAKGNNGLIKAKYVTFGTEAENYKAAKIRLEQVELDLMNHFKRLGAKAEPMDGYERLQLLHSIFHMDNPDDSFMFDWKWLPATGLSTQDFIAPTSFHFKDSKRFSMGDKLATVSLLQIYATEMTDRILVDILGLDASQIVTMHIRAVDHTEAVKMLKRKITDLDKAKIDEQKKAVRAGYDIDILPSDLATYGKEVKKIFDELQTHNEHLFLMTFLIMHTADTRKQLDNIFMQAQSIAQEKSCKLVTLDFQQEQAMVSSLPLGFNQVEIERAMTTSSTAIFVPFITQELFHTTGEPLYYGLNALSNNLIMADRKQLKNPNGLILGTPGCFTGDTRIQLADGTDISFDEMIRQGIDETEVLAYDEKNDWFVQAHARDIRIEKYVTKLCVLELDDGSVVRCTDNHLIMTEDGQYRAASEIQVGTVLSGALLVMNAYTNHLDEPEPVYDMIVDRYNNFILSNSLIVHNSGKSFSAKREIINVFLSTDDDIILCDPEGEYSPLTETLHGQVIRLSPTSTDHINPLDINANYSDEDEPLALKADLVLSFCELIMGAREGLTAIERTLIDRSVRNIYRGYFADPRPENMPILEDLYNELKRQPEAAAGNIAAALELYVHGSLNVFNHRTNVKLNSRLVCLDIKQLGQHLKKTGMLIVQDFVWGKVTQNRDAQKYTWYFCDEFHLLLREEQTAAYCVEIWKRFRKWLGIPTGITQNVKDLLSSPEAETIFENSDFVLMLNQAAGDRAVLAKRLNISNHQLSHVTQSGEGEGLLFFGNVILPFLDRFPKNTKLYKIMTTKPNDLKEQGGKTA